MFVWRLFQNRLPTKANLFRRGIIPREAQICVGGCGMQEMDVHLFLNCGNFWSDLSYGSQFVGCSYRVSFNHSGAFSTIWYVFRTCKIAVLFHVFGMVWELLGLSGRKEMIDFFKSKKTPFFSFWRALNLFPFGGIRQSLLLLLISLMIGARTIYILVCLAS